MLVLRRYKEERYPVCGPGLHEPCGTYAGRQTGVHLPEAHSDARSIGRAPYAPVFKAACVKKIHY